MGSLICSGHLLFWALSLCTQVKPISMSQSLHDCLSSDHSPRITTCHEVICDDRITPLELHAGTEKGINADVNDARTKIICS